MSNLHIVIGDGPRQALLQKEPLVLTESAVCELSRLKAAARGLRALGFRLTGEQLPLNIEGARAEVVIAPDQDMKPLLERCTGGVAYMRVSTGRLRGWTEFLGIIVSWEEKE